MKLEHKKNEMAKRMNPNRGHLNLGKLKRDYKAQKGKGSLNPIQKSKDNMITEARNEQERP